MELTKAALLYADAVTVLSPVTTMLARVADFGRLSERTQIGLIQRVAPYLMTDAEAASVRSDLDSVAPFLSKRRRAGTRADLLLRGLITAQLAPLRQAVSAIAEGALRGAGFSSVRACSGEGVGEVRSCEHGDDLELIASCVIMAKRAETGQPPEEPQMNHILQTFSGKLSAYLSSGRDYLLCDEPLASLLDSAIEDGLVRPVQRPVGRSAQVLAGSGLMAYLPTFPDATVDEVLDIRAALASSLTRFRGIMVSASRALASKPSDLTSHDELRDIWTERVQPAITDIETAVRDNRSLLPQVPAKAARARELVRAWRSWRRAWRETCLLSTGRRASRQASPALAAAWYRH